MNTEQQTRKGFSLIEMMVSVTIFAIVMLIGVGALLSLIETNRRAQAINSTVNNLNAALEGMSRSIRTGISYYCSTNANININGISGQQDCVGEDGGRLIAFRPSSGSNNITAYRLSSGQLQRNVGSGWIDLTAPEITIDTFRVWVRGSAPGDGEQPRALMVIKGSAPVPGGRTEFQIQSSVTQRILDI
ncbi:hypothetical protein COU15_02250 [Candidatus Kaiserbacteria bacterium CG10_big_fil_rev_8_21_14_0_10_45_20]|uniref:Prepilin-type N-terminal cleavage/methylation domain-containing protein n=1 Tax=Candidatus Kaiserbacteria bacterium CG10_big_fil_rev_8_21_14_0_10_45_20 TaxID=1974607 RepID=A0A2H0UHC4_9BACT|nr:MAG: hypothetical protein COU15_02250 [Candidatus Kaiserbacteria bacterium CG10_big_fil_rev_8_21_14_0_10_45_20]